MKLQIKLSNNKCLVIEIEETKTVTELKEKLSQHLGLPRNFIISYEGKILEDTKKLSAYNIDERKILTTIMPKKRPNGAAAVEAQNDVLNERVTPENIANVDRMLKELAKCESAGESNRNGHLIDLITEMGFEEDEVRRALAECCYNPKRAVEYILNNTPITPSSVGSEYYSDTDDETPLSFRDLFQNEPALKRLRYGIFHESYSYSLNAAVERMTEQDPSLLEEINENPEDFLDYFQNYEFEVENEPEDNNFEAIEDEQDGQDGQDDKNKNDKVNYDNDKQKDKTEGDEVRIENIEGANK